MTHKLIVMINLAFTLLILFNIHQSVLARTIDQSFIDNEWHNFKQTFSRKYLDANEELKRKEIFVQNLEIILEQNEKFDKKQSSYQLGVNQYADWTMDEFRRLVKSDKPRVIKEPSNLVYTDDNVEDLPDEVDWTTKGVVTPVKNMGNCGSGYAFGPVQALESQHALKTGQLVSLSEQQVIDCSMDQWNNGCQGGLIDNSFDYILAFHGKSETEKSYPYVGPYSSGCREDNKTVGAIMKAYVDLKRFSEDVLQSAVAKIGPVAISIDADSPHFMLYKSGVYDYDDCNMLFIDHGMTVVGYGTLDGKQYWKIKNSMGTTWGIKGYILMVRNKDNQCGVASTPSYPVV